MEVSNISSHIDSEDHIIFGNWFLCLYCWESEFIRTSVCNSIIIGGKSAQATKAGSSQPERTISWRRRQTSSDDSPSPPRPARQNQFLNSKYDCSKRQTILYQFLSLVELLCKKINFLFFFWSDFVSNLLEWFKVSGRNFLSLPLALIIHSCPNQLAPLHQITNQSDTCKKD